MEHYEEFIPQNTSQLYAIIENSIKEGAPLQVQFDELIQYIACLESRLNKAEEYVSYLKLYKSL